MFGCHASILSPSGQLHSGAGSTLRNRWVDLALPLHPVDAPRPVSGKGGSPMITRPATAPNIIMVTASKPFQPLSTRTPKMRTINRKAQLPLLVLGARRRERAGEFFNQGTQSVAFGGQRSNPLSF